MSSIPHLRLDSNLFSLLLFLLSLLFLTLKTLKHHKNRPQKPRLPSPRGIPVLGNLHQLGSYPHRSLHAFSDRLGPLFLLRLGRVPTLVVSSAAAAEAVLKTNDLAFSSRPQTLIPSILFYGCRDVAFSPYSEYWRQLRRVSVLHLLSAKRVSSFRAVREEEVSFLVDRLRATSAADIKGNGVNVSELIVALTNKVVSRAAFGSDVCGMGPAELRETLAEFSLLLGTVAVSDFFPWLRWLDRARGLEGRARRVARALDEILERVLDEHEKRGGGAGDGDGDGDGRDLVDVLLSVARGEEEGGGGFKLGRDEMKALILDMFAAGTDTVYKTIEWTMAALIKNPREMRRVQQEVRQIVGSKGSNKIAEEYLDEMAYLKASMKEAMRLHPPVPLLVKRETIEHTNLFGYEVPAKTQVIINAWAIGKDPKLWERPQEFCPERFVHSSIDFKGQDFKFIPFGAGRRGCPGVTFATHLVELALANMLYHFDWGLPNGQSIASFDLHELKGMSPSFRSGLILVAKPRTE